MLLALALAGDPAVDPWHVELGVAATASAPASNVETKLLLWPSLRFGKWLALGSDVAYGFDGAVLGSWERDGTSEVATTRALGAVEGRALFSPARVTSAHVAVVPYGFAGVLFGGGFVDTQAFSQSDARGIGTWGARAGFGGCASIYGVTTSLELGAGMRDLRFELSSTLALGYVF
jgi:hypothetical protein